MTISRRIAFAAAAFTGLSAPAVAQAYPEAEEAQTIRALDMMLMATSLRCRQSVSDFRAEYKVFTRYNQHHLSNASATIRANLTAAYGQKGGERALDRMGVQIANRYGNGHPWLDCSELKQAAGELARAHTSASLAQIGGRLINGPRIAYDLP